MLFSFNILILLFLRIKSKDVFLRANALRREERTEFYRGTRVIYYIVENVIEGELNFDIISIEKIGTLRYVTIKNKKTFENDDVYLYKKDFKDVYGNDTIKYTKADNGQINGYKYSIFHYIEEEEVSHFVLRVMVSQYDGMFYIYSRLRGGGGGLGILFGLGFMAALLLMFEFIKRKLNI